MTSVTDGRPRWTSYLRHFLRLAPTSWRSPITARAQSRGRRVVLDTQAAAQWVGEHKAAGTDSRQHRVDRYPGAGGHRRQPGPLRGGRAGRGRRQSGPARPPARRDRVSRTSPSPMTRPPRRSATSPMPARRPPPGWWRTPRRTWCSTRWSARWACTPPWPRCTAAPGWRWRTRNRWSPAVRWYCRAAKPGQIVPVDSEHSALAQCLLGGTPDEVAKIGAHRVGRAVPGLPRQPTSSTSPPNRPVRIPPGRWAR